MKKLINGKHVEVNKEFFTDYQYGKELSKITLSTIDNELEFGKEINSIIEDYRNCYYNLHPIMQVIDTDLKYCLMGELIDRPYKVIRGKLCFDLKGSVLKFKGTHWSIEDKSPDKGITWKDCTGLTNYPIYANYLKTNGKHFIQTNFPELWEACDQNKDKCDREIDNILHFIDIEELLLDDDEIIDLDLRIRYRVMPGYLGTEGKGTKSKSLVVDLQDKGTKITKTSKQEHYTFSVYKQNMIEGESGRKDFGKEEKVEGMFEDIFEVLHKHNISTLRGIKINNLIYFECGDDIYCSSKGESSIVIQKAKLYGTKLNNLLVKWEQTMNERITKRIVYLLKDDYLDIADISFFKKD